MIQLISTMQKIFYFFILCKIFGFIIITVAGLFCVKLFFYMISYFAITNNDMGLLVINQVTMTLELFKYIQNKQFFSQNLIYKLYCLY